MAEDVPTTLSNVKDFRDVISLDKFLQNIDVQLENFDFQ